MADVVLEIPRIGDAVAIPAIALDQDRAGGDGVDADASGTNSSAQRSVSKISAASTRRVLAQVAKTGPRDHTILKVHFANRGRNV
jgi:hypothetical protein